MTIDITKTDYKELLHLLDWASSFIRERHKSAREDDHARRINRIKSHLLKKNPIAYK